jgi:putative ABC transport system permease protein
MLHNYLAAALRNLVRNRLYAAVTIAGLAIGFAAAMLIGLYVRDELTYDRFVSGYRQVYTVTQYIRMGPAIFDEQATPMMMARPLKADFPEIQYVARLSPSYFPPTVRRGDLVAGEQQVYWADPDFFRVMPVPVVAGDLAGALDAPDSIVLTRSFARKYFKADAPIGQTLQVNGAPFRVTAVIEDLPSNTDLPFEAVASAKAAISPITQYEPINGPLTNTLATYVRLKPGASPAAMSARFPRFLQERLPLAPFGMGGVKVSRQMFLVPISELHLHKSTTSAFSNGRGPVDPAVLAAIAAVGVLIVAVAAINFVTLMTARAARRAVEVGVRKAAGASRRDLVVQFMGEAFLYVAAASILAVSLAELLMPAVNTLLQRKLTFDYLHDPLLAAAILGVLALVAVLAGAYPAFVLSGFRPSAVLKGGPMQSVGGRRVREVLVVAQFAVLIGLVLIAVTIARQTRYALNEGMRVNKDQVLLLFSSPCIETVRDEAVRLPGVKGAACASTNAMNLSNAHDAVTRNGRMTDLATAGVDYGFFQLFGIQPIAGRLFERARAADAPVNGPTTYGTIVLNESAVRRLGFPSPQAAIGHVIFWHGMWDSTQRKPTFTVPPPLPSEIVGVVPDFTFGSVRNRIDPTLFVVGRNVAPNSIALAVKLDAGRIPETMASLQALWKRVVPERPYLPIFVDRYTMRLYVDTIIQGATVAIAGLIALTVAALGLFALSAYTTERRTKEIGVRKAMGASSADILKLLLWQFTKPVIWANVIAWPAAFFVLRWWLASFAYHVGLAPWTFVAAGAGALLIAWATVFVHALNVARAKPVGALRYE